MIYISMGTVMKNREIYRNCVEAFRDTDYQVIISLGANEEGDMELPGNIRVYTSVNQMAVLSAADVFLTHCSMSIDRIDGPIKQYLSENVSAHG